MSRRLPGEPVAIPGGTTEILQQMWDETTKHVCKDYDILLRENTTISYRDQPDPTLLVARQPHEVRPPSDTGVQYHVTEDGNFELSLNDAPRRPEYEVGNVQLHTAWKLCQACIDCLNYYCQYREMNSKRASGDNSQVPLSNSVIHHFNLWSLLAWSPTGCRFCRMVLLRLMERYPRAILEASNLELFRTEICWAKSTKLEGKDRLYFVLLQISKPRDVFNWDNFLRLDLWPADNFSHHFLPPPEIAIAHWSWWNGLPGPDRDSTASPRTQALALLWLSKCKANEKGKHHECNLRQLDYLPTRLLDVGKALQTDMLHLVSPDTEPALFVEDRDYITLSHCWGELGSQRIPLLTEENFEERRRGGIHIKDLPKTFQDAIQIASWYKVKWLWIDSLCIKQGSQDDWRREVSLMSETYKNALLNISADFGRNSEAGCFVDRKSLDITPLSFRAPQLKQSWFVIPDPHTIFEWMEEAPSFGRAWIHRERQLARRVLHFTEKEVVWECCGTEGTGFASEMLPGGAPFKNTFRLSNKYQVGRLQQNLAQDGEETYAVWNDTCESLSTKGLTEPTDMPIILSSMAKDFAQRLPSDNYVAGLWRSTLPQSLLWHTRSQSGHRGSYFAPSWSWLSVSCPVQLASRATVKRQHPLARVDVDDIPMEFQYDKPFGPLKSASIPISGILRRVQLSFGKKIRGHDLRGFNLSVYEGEEQHRRSIGPSWDDYEGEFCTVELDEPPEDLEVDYMCLLVMIEQSNYTPSHRIIRCLLLHATDEEENTFKRVGVLELKDLYALKMRYRLTDVVVPAGVNETKLWQNMAGAIKAKQDKLIRDLREEKRKNRKQAGDQDGEGGGEVGEGEGVEDDAKDNGSKQGIDALYQFDAALREPRFLSKVEPQGLTIR